MAYKDFREFLEVLRENNELIEVNRPVALKLEVGKALRKSAAVSGLAILLHHLKNYAETGVVELAFN